MLRATGSRLSLACRREAVRQAPVLLQWKVFASFPAFKFMPRSCIGLPRLALLSTFKQKRKPRTRANVPAKALAQALRQVFLRVHPDLFASHPRMQKLNGDSLATLNAMFDVWTKSTDELDAMLRRHGAEFRAGKSVELSFYVRSPSAESDDSPPQISHIHVAIKLPDLHFQTQRRLNQIARMVEPLLDALDIKLALQEPAEAGVVDSTAANEGEQSDDEQAAENELDTSRSQEPALNFLRDAVWSAHRNAAAFKAAEQQAQEMLNALKRDLLPRLQLYSQPLPDEVIHSMQQLRLALQQLLGSSTAPSANAGKSRDQLQVQSSATHADFIRNELPKRVIAADCSSFSVVPSRELPNGTILLQCADANAIASFLSSLAAKAATSAGKQAAQAVAVSERLRERAKEMDSKLAQALRVNVDSSFISEAAGFEQYLSVGETVLANLMFRNPRHSAERKHLLLTDESPWGVAQPATATAAAPKTKELEAVDPDAPQRFDFTLFFSDHPWRMHHGAHGAMGLFDLRANDIDVWIELPALLSADDGGSEARTPTERLLSFLREHGPTLQARWAVVDEFWTRWQALAAQVCAKTKLGALEYSSLLRPMVFHGGEGRRRALAAAERLLRMGDALRECVPALAGLTLRIGHAPAHFEIDARGHITIPFDFREDVRQLADALLQLTASSAAPTQSAAANAATASEATARTPS